MKCRGFAGAVVYGLALTTASQAAEPVSGAEEWKIECGPESCQLRHSMMTTQYGAPLEIGIGIEFSRSTAAPTVAVIVVPAAADRKAGVHIGFGDVPSTDQNSKAVPQREPIYFTMPMGKCDAQLCTAGIKNGDGNRDIRKYFTDYFASYPFFTVVYEENGDYRTFIEPTALFNKGHQTLLAALKKPQ